MEQVQVTAGQTQALLGALDEVGISLIGSIQFPLPVPAGSGTSMVPGISIDRLFGEHRDRRGEK